MSSDTMRVRATARVEAVAPEGCERLVQFLKAYRDAVQEIVNELWCCPAFGTFEDYW